MYSLPGGEDPIRHKLYRSFTHRPDRRRAAPGARELDEKLNGFRLHGANRCPGGSRYQPSSR